ncbi:MAG: hypothetical protein KF696_16060 [Planctomycetes bacterium]|nr:hypothetical protein [Planctomycetota bacterium]MCW8137249.1 hypothetical protein [Planctomycetota bacterium]
MAAVKIICPHCNREQKVAQHRLADTVVCMLCEHTITDVYLYKVADAPPELDIALKGRLVTDSGSHNLQEIESKADAYSGREDSRDMQAMRETVRLIGSGMYKAPPQRRVSTATKTWATGIALMVLLLVAFAILAWQVMSSDSQSGKIITAADEKTRIERHPNGTIAAEWGIRRDGGSEVLHGPFQQWYPTGARKAVGAYDNGLRTGQWQEWHSNGQMAMQGQFKDDRPDGDYQEWHSNGERAVKGRYIDGLKDGEWLSWHSNKVQASIEHWKGGEPHGDWFMWHASGNTRLRGAHKDGEKEGRWVTYFDNSVEELVEVWVHGRRQGRSFGHFFNRQLRFEGVWTDGMQTGQWSWWHINGELQTQGIFDHGLKEGKWQEWYADKTLKEVGEYRADLRHGTWVEHDEDGSECARREYSGGSLVSEELLFRGETVARKSGPEGEKGRKAEWTVKPGTSTRHGIWREFHENGTVAVKGYFVEGREDGPWKTYDTSGNLLREVQWQEGKRVQ